MPNYLEIVIVVVCVSFVTRGVSKTGKKEEEDMASVFSPLTVN